jgi:hypothetical protein
VGQRVTRLWKEYCGRTKGLLFPTELLIKSTATDNGWPNRPSPVTAVVNIRGMWSRLESRTKAGNAFVVVDNDTTCCTSAPRREGAV